MDGKMLARLSAVVFVGVAITVTVVELTRTPDASEVRILDRNHIRPTDPLRASLRHCRDRGEAAIRDPACLKAWADSRDRFLGQMSSAASPTEPPPAPTTLFPADAAPTDDPLRPQTAPAAAVALKPNGAN